MADSLKSNLSQFSTSTAPVTLLSKVLENILKSPDDEKYRKLKTDKVEPKLAGTKGALEFLLAAGFVKTDTHYVLPSSASMDTVRTASKLLEGALGTSTHAHTHSSAGDCCSSSSSSSSSAAKAKADGCCGGNSTAKKSGGCCSTTVKAEESEEQRAFREKRESKEELLKKIAINKKEKSQDTKFVVDSKAHGLKFGSTKGGLPPPSACKTG